MTIVSIICPSGTVGSDPLDTPFDEIMADRDAAISDSIRCAFVGDPESINEHVRRDEHPRWVFGTFKLHGVEHYWVVSEGGES